MANSLDVSRPVRLRLDLHPKQRLIFASDANEICYGGALGSGKSFATRAAAIVYAVAIPKLQIYFFRRTYPELVQTHMRGAKSFPDLLNPLVIAGMCRISEREITFWNKSRISLHHCERESDVEIYKGVEFHMLVIDELTSFTEYMFRVLRSRCGLGSLVLPIQFVNRFPLIVSTCTPGQVGHQWVRETFVDGGDMVIRQRPDHDGGGRRLFIAAYLCDNPSMESGYEAKVRGLGDPALISAGLRGDWDVVSGGMFAASWDKSRHVCRSFPLLWSWDLWRSGDDGFVDPMCVLWLTRDPVFDRFFVVSELFQPGLLADQAAKLILERDKSLLRCDAYDHVYPNSDRLKGILDASAFSNSGQGVPSRGETMNRTGLRWTPAQKEAGSRKLGIMRIHELLADGKDGKPRLQIFESCRNLVKALPQAQRRPSDPEDIMDFGLDHCIDSLRYGLSWRPSSFGRARLTNI
jgi:hypothetical protein